MVRGFYTAASGIVTQEKKLNSVANNISNVSTVGYKRENIVMGTFGEHLTIRREAYQNAGHNPVGPSVYMQIVDDKYTHHEQGGFEATSRPMDLALMGNGFFVIDGYDGEEVLTRDGQFSLDEDGYLILPGFGRVQGEGGDIEVGFSSTMRVDSRGMVYVQDPDELEEEEIDRLLIALPDDYTTVEKVANSHFVCDGYTLLNPEDIDDDEVEMPMVRQYQLEKSNVNMSDEMTTMIASQRQLQSCSQIVKMYDELASQINSSISRI